MDKEDLLRSGAALDAFLREFDACAITPTRKLIAAYVRGQLGALPRKSVMPIAREAGIAPRTLQEMLSLHRWNEELMRTILRERIRRAFAGPRTVSVIHESACVKKGDMTPGVDRQHSPATGKVANCCVILHLAVASPRGFRAVAESELFLPQKWVENKSLRKAARVPEEVGFQSRTKLTLGLVDRSLNAGIPLGTLLLGPSAGADPALLRDLDGRGVRYLASLPAPVRGWTALPRSAADKPRSLDLLTAKETFPLRVVIRGERSPDSAHPVPAGATPFYPEIDGAPGPVQQLLVFRHPWTSEARYVATNIPPPASIPSLVEAALARRPLEDALNRDLAQIGFDHFEVRRFRSLQRHLTLSALSVLFLAESGIAAERKVKEQGDASLLTAL